MFWDIQHQNLSRDPISYNRPSDRPVVQRVSMSLICVVGATGTQGGSVCRELVKMQSWKVRGLCRNTQSANAKELQALGVEMVSADLDSPETLVNAFKGAVAIFATGYFWHFVPQMSLQAAGEAELKQLINVANAAAKIPTLQHLVLSVLPHCDKISGGKLPCTHLDCKALASEYVKRELPHLAAKTTYLWVGFYFENFLAQENGLMRPQPFFGKYLLALPSKPNGVVPIAGLVSKNVGIAVRGILASGSRVFRKYVPLVTNYVTMTDIVAAWSEVTGETAAFAEIEDSEYAKLFGPFGTEMALQFRFSEAFPNWLSLFPTETSSLRDIGVESELVGFHDGLQQFRAQLIL
ncbi:hypothetical protein BDV24DRAFT_133631 [Aspergillus arachidicola]|uniref:NmrA-like domain-containing protein n=1 Tax=Aspergillus arachidicola TaxID=656916 RepID=A0A5N6Y5G0_9EURO|nr:hypothetical protein BDV24DRAFT_133631 [Aspergillus arachidicola]